ncbi:hypothetical protein TVAG_490710 [Trichomonas vaginalis G3]|uniref:Uncharacterized protein n=1 Tax=Trichomonas vaginalis (strain ATCC PRA-98 / G3) TaxID=412133 RepID=A2GKC6_TRIV3|nr:hypothetical protein TVAG_490710 [Trichomonas vaginalis G3]|eukprot:XP_001295324.1 hypothetical protein [Trichomonas vaginalis G3]
MTDLLTEMTPSWRDEVQQNFLECKEDTCAVLENEIENRIEELLNDKALLQKYGSEKFDITPPEKKKREKKGKESRRREERTRAREGEI